MRFNMKYVNIATWITLITAYILPYRTTDGFETTFGYPLAFFTIYDTPKIKTIISSTTLQLGTFLINVLIFYFIIYFISVLRDKYRDKSE